jgi:hypothetical protein
MCRALPDLPFWDDCHFGKLAAVPQAVTFLFATISASSCRTVHLTSTCNSGGIAELGEMELTFLVGRDGQNVKRPRKACTPCRQKKVQAGIKTLRPVVDSRERANLKLETVLS